MQSIIQLTGGFVVTALLAATGPALAQSNDPTRPPPAWLPAQSAAQAQSAAPAQMPVEEAVGGSHIVVLGSDRRFVMLNGHVVHVGESHNGARLLAINDDSLVWQKEGVRHRLNISPGAVKSAPGTISREGKLVVPKNKTGEGQ